MWITLILLAIFGLGIVFFLNTPQFGRTPKGERLERIKQSPNYRGGKFQNLNETPQITSDKSYFAMLIDFVFKKKERNVPIYSLPTIKTDLLNLDPSEDILVWFGHSSYFMQIGGKRILVDPVLGQSASPVSFVNKPFKGTDIYKPEDIPPVDYLFISHDHWDHLDYPTVKELKPRIGKVICALGVGEHFEYWGFDKSKIIELDWNEEARLGNGFKTYCLPARHFSGRGLLPNQSLWASFLLETPAMKIYIGGDSGYDTHFEEIGQRFGTIDLAILEDGQYDEGWKYIHTMPGEVLKAAKNLNTKRLLPVHNSKFALANHSWNEPLKKVTELYADSSYLLLTPKIGEKMVIGKDDIQFSKWWEGYK